MIDYNSVIYFLKVAHYESFSEAARRLKVPVSTVSRKVGELEKQLGVRLLERSTRSMRLTELGRVYFEKCFQAMEEIENANIIINEKQVEVSGTLRLSVPPNIENICVPLVMEFQESYPKAKVNMLITERKINLIEEGVDLAFRVGLLDDSSLIQRRLLTYRHILVASPDYIAIHGTPSKPQEIASHRVVGFSSWFKEVIWKLIHLNGASKKVIVKPDFIMNSYEGVQKAVIRGYGISEIPWIICNKYLKSSELVQIMPEWSFYPTTLSAIYPSRRNLSRLVGLFINFSEEFVNRDSKY